MEEPRKRAQISWGTGLEGAESGVAVEGEDDDVMCVDHASREKCESGVLSYLGNRQDS